jgi:hypothetical protein
MGNNGTFNSKSPDWHSVVDKYNQTIKGFIDLQNSHFDASRFFFEPKM